MWHNKEIHPTAKANLFQEQLVDVVKLVILRVG
jgi:hypothetical protein